MKSSLRAAVAVAVGVLLVGAGRASGNTGGAVVKGRVLLEGTPPAPVKAKVSADPNCRSQHPDGLEQSAVEVSNGGLSGVVVYLKAGVKGAFEAPATPVALDQKGCQYFPSMIAVQAGQPVKIRNSDSTLHNVHFRPRLNPEINIGQPRAGMESTRIFPKPEVLVPIGCDVHPWMRAHMAVLPHPFFAVSGKDGGFEIQGVPPGTYEVEARHPSLPPVTVTVEVGGAGATVDFTLVAP